MLVSAKKLIGIIILLVGAGLYLLPQPMVEKPASGINGDEEKLAYLFEKQQSDIQLKGSGIVIRLLPDDSDGSRHQRFILKMSNGQTVLVAHNIDLAPRIDHLKIGDRVSFFGEYVWNRKGGVIHWTHHDPAGRHVDGWLEHQGRRYK